MKYDLMLTKDGEILYGEFKNQFSVMESIVQDLKSDKTKVSGMIRIGSWLELCESYLPRMIKSFSEEYPLVDFEIYTGIDEELESLLLSNKIDISHQLMIQNQRVLQKKPILRAALLPVVSKGYAQCHKLPKTIKQTLDMPILDFHSEYSVYTRWIKKNARELLFSAQKKTTFIRVSNNITLKQLTLQGLGLGFLPHRFIEEELDSGELIALPLPKRIAPIEVEFDMVYKRQHSLGYIHQAFIEHVLRDTDCHGC